MYWKVFNKSIRAQNILLLVASYIFYGWWDWRFLILITFSAIMDFSLALLIYRSNEKIRKKILVGISLFINIGLLVYFKYCNFFIESFELLLTNLGFQANHSSLQIILPVGISFYTFQTVSYTLDIYRNKLVPTKDIISFFAFVSFFPQLVAGPIERAINLLPQFYKSRDFKYDQCVDGLKQILWGLFKKIVIADNCAEYANLIFDNPNLSGSTHWLGAILFAFQIYGDFSGYSDIAIGSARLFGFNLVRNFDFPYFSRNVPEFWRRWHISLSTWFRDYVYIPLGGSKGTKYLKVRNIMIIFLLSGFWHGANWTFIIWGLLNALFMLPSVLSQTSKAKMDIVAKGKILPNFKQLAQIIFTFLLITIAWVFFRADNVSMAFSFLGKMFSASIISMPEIRPTFILIMLLVFIFLEWFGREDQYAISNYFIKAGKPVRWTFYLALVISVFLFGGKPQDFIYFQF